MHVPTVVVTVLSLAGIAIVGLLTHNDPISYIAVGALAGYLGKVNGAKGKARPRE